MADSTQHADPAGAIPAGPVADDARRASAVSRAGAGWRLFRDWRRSRPFWAGLLLVIAGAELLLLPLPMHSMGLILHIGIGGVAGILIGAVLIVAGLLLWINPAQRTFYSIVAVLLAVTALIASNLGGFLLGTILGVVGGSLGFAWAPLPPGAAPRRLRRRGPTTPADTAPGHIPLADQDPDATATSADTSADETAGGGGEAPVRARPVTAMPSEWGRLDPSWGAAGSGEGMAGLTARYAEAGSPHGRSAPHYRNGPARGTVIGGNIVTALICLLSFGLFCQNSSPTQPTDPPAAATPAPSASPSASASASPSTRPSASPSAAATPRARPAAASPSPSPSPAPTGSVPPFALATSQSTLTASSVSMTGFAYDGVVSVPTAAGSVRMMQFSASTLDLSGVNLAVTQGGATMTTTASALDLNGHVVLYATQLSGDLLGIPLTITPNTPLATILQLLGKAGVSQLLPLTMTNVTTLQPFTSANGMTASALQIS